MTDLDPKATFETFVVGPANRLASAAARRAAESPGTAYNPLFLYSSSGLGKSHILSAVAHQARKTDLHLRTRYQTIEGFIEELAEALEGGQRDQMRDQYRELDILLLDDVQFLAGQPEAQEMLLATLDALTGSGSQIVLASDRPPADINGLDARLVSRFSGGLIVDIAPPEYETRVAIIRRKTEERGQTLEPGVAEALARYPFQNVRELGGALNRVLAAQDLEDRRLSPGDIPVLLGEISTEVAGAGSAEMGGLLTEVVDAVADQVEFQETGWRKSLREAAEAAEREGFVATRLRGHLESQSEPSGWEETLERFRDDVTRLREIDRELDRLGNPWEEAAVGLLRDPERRDEAEAFLASVRERVRPFAELSDGPALAEVSGAFPKLALRAAEQLVAPEKPQYNPLFLWSGDSDAAVKLLAAAGRTFRGLHPEGRMAVTSVTDFSEDFIRALSEGVAGAWRERWWTVDLLLVYGAQALSDTERAQDEFFHLFEALKRRGARVLLAADCAPSDIRNIDERLRSRFEGGLVLEVEGDGFGGGEVAVAIDDTAAPQVADTQSGWEDVTRQAQVDAVPAAEAEAAAEGRGVVPPLDEIDFGDGRAGLFFESDDEAPASPPDSAPAADSAPTSSVDPSPAPAELQSSPVTPATPAAAEPEEPGSWMPSREKVIWVWPSLDDRLVEELE